MDRRKFLALSGATAVGAATSLTPQLAHAANSQTQLNAQDFGLEPNSNRDQTTILQKAVNQAAQQKLPLFIPAGAYKISYVELPDGTYISGVKGQTILVQAGNQNIIFAGEANHISLSKLNFKGNQSSQSPEALIAFTFVSNLNISQCDFSNGNAAGLEMFKVSAQIIDNKFHDLAKAAIVSADGQASNISRNEIYNMGNNGILIWREQKGDVNIIVNYNQIRQVRADDGGNGQNGNGINVFRANNVIMSDNIVSDCEYTAIRINDGNNCQIINNHCTNIGEVALYAEFGFNGVIINNNLVDTAGAGISMANLDQNGHLAICKGNLLRNLTLRPTATSNDDARAYGIAAEADALIEGNVIENATNFGIGGGYGEFQRNISVVNNMLKDCGYGITASVVEGAGRMTISNNSINNAPKGGIVGFAWNEAVTGDLIDDNQNFGQGSQSNLNISNNVTT